MDLKEPSFREKEHGSDVEVEAEREEDQVPEPGPVERDAGETERKKTPIVKSEWKSPMMARWEAIMWPALCGFMVLWCHTIVAGISQNQLMFRWPRHGLRTGWLPSWLTTAVFGIMKAQTAIMNVLLRVVGLWGPEFEHTNALGLQDEVEHGWQVGRWVDHTNPQWSSFRDSLFILVPAMLAISLISRAVQRAAPRAHRPVMLVVGLAFLIRAHGSRTLYFLTAAALNYAAARALPSSWVAEPSLWALNLALLVAIRFYHGFSSSFLPAVLRAPLDALGGDVRWDVCFNISMLRFLSFGLDLARARREHRAGKVPPRLGKVKAGEEEAAGDRRDPGSLPVEAYTAGAYLEYVAYPPLYVAGPIVTFDNFTRARLSPPGMLPAGFLVRYAARAALGIMCVEVLLHFNYLDFIVKGRGRVALDTISVHHLGCIGFAYLMFMWLKFLSFWRFFRFFALLDGIPAPENMRRCICNNMSVQGFWREWHTSYYQWLVRYIYVPLGGSRRRLLAVPIVFGFVAFWHELDFRLISHLLVWAGIMALFILPEVFLQRSGFLSDPPGAMTYADMRGKRWAQALYGSVIITILVAANTAGFCFGGAGLRALFTNVISGPGFRLLVGALVFFFSGAQTMLEVRAHERRESRRIWPWDPVDKQGAFCVLR